MKQTTRAGRRLFLSFFPLRYLAFFFFLSLSPHMFSQELFIPPELKWWFDEVQSVDKRITVDRFVKAGEEVFAITNGAPDKAGLYPIFYRWNFSGNYLGYFNAGHSLRMAASGKYSVLRDVDSAVLILSKDFKILLRDTFGATSGINAIAWLGDNVLIAVGTAIDPDGVSLMVKQYEIRGATIIVQTYLLKNALTNDQRLKLRLDWTEQRPDYFL